MPVKINLTGICYHQKHQPLHFAQLIHNKKELIFVLDEFELLVDVVVLDVNATNLIFFSPLIFYI